MNGRVRRRDAVRILLSRAHVSQSVKIVRPPQWRRSILAGAQAALAVAVAVSVVALSPLSDFIGAASLGAMAALFGRFAPHRRRNLIVVHSALCMALAIAATSLASFAGLGVPGLLVLLSGLGAVFFLISMLGRFGPPGALIFMFAGMAGMSAPAGWGEVGLRIGVCLFGGGVAVAVCAATEFLRRDDPVHSQATAPLRTQLSMLAPTFLRLPVGASIAGLVAWKLGMSHPEWAAMGAAAALQGVHLHSTFHRALQRVAGTLVGAVLIWLVLTQEPTVWSALTLLVGLQLVTEVVIGFNYALGQVFVTPMALLMTYMASPGASGASMALERVLDTVVGVVVGIAVSIIISTRTDRHNLHEHHGM